VVTTLRLQHKLFNKHLTRHKRQLTINRKPNKLRHSNNKNSFGNNKFKDKPSCRNSKKIRIDRYSYKSSRKKIGPEPLSN
jgi:hypothetical protein